MIEKKAFTVLKYSLLPARIMVVAIARRFKFQKRSQLFIGVHNETLSIIACNPRSFADGNQSLRRSPNSNRLC